MACCCTHRSQLLPTHPLCALPVQGGGLCDVDNLRTLCVACHADVTKEQAKERAATKRQGKAGGGGGGPGWEDVEAAGADCRGRRGEGVLPLRHRCRGTQA